jgi:hypothetical protein
VGCGFSFYSWRLKNLKSGWHENAQVFIAEGIQADISGSIHPAADLCDAYYSIADSALGSRL